MITLAIDTSCDETAAAVVQDNKILSNVIWSQASAHAKFGGVMPSLAQRMHEERIDFVVQKALANGKCKMENLDCIATTVGPGLSIALGVGINKAKELAKKYSKPFIPVNHLEGHLFSSNTKVDFPALGLVISGGNTIFVKINKVGDYEILAQTSDDALGEALDKAARMLGLGYPGGALLEKMARLGDPKKYKLPIPMSGREDKQIFSYSGLKTAMMRLIKSLEPLDKQKTYDLAACFQDVAFQHLTRVIRFAIENSKLKIVNSSLLVGERDEFFVLVLGGVENDDLPPLNEDRPPLNDDLLPLKDDPPPLDRPPLKRCAGAIEGNVSDTINK
jgi:N6-L-threonylcarbamoyladenine synthase